MNMLDLAHIDTETTAVVLVVFMLIAWLWIYIISKLVKLFSGDPDE